MIRIPRYVEVHGKRIRVRQVAKSRLVNDEGEELEGQFDPTKGEILLDKSLPPEVKATAYRHELGHAVIWETGLYALLEKATNQGLAELLDEHICMMFVPAFVSALRRS